MAKDSTTTLIRISIKTKQELSKRGNLDDSMDTVIQKLLRGKKK